MLSRKTLTDKARILESNEFMEYAQTKFPEIRKQGMTLPIIRCDICIASSLFANIKDGLCELCRTQQSLEIERGKSKGVVNEDEAAELHDILERGCGRGEQLYDALVMFSGGKDSTYLVHKLRSEYPGLRILAVTVDSGFASSAALQNARNVGSRLEGIDTMVLHPRKDLFS